jgi:uncharacterized repeat protein (TIGR03803 family)
VFKIAADGTKTIEYSFAGKTDGARPSGGLTMDAQGNLYGTTSLGGLGFGTVFKIAPDGSETLLHTFAGTDGNLPSGGLIMDASGNLYGPTAAGGPGGGQFGEIFKITTDSALTVLHAFNHADGDGAYPLGALAMDSKGNLYGTTTEGGTGCGGYGCGTVFKITKGGAYSKIYSFKGRVAHNPLGGVVSDANGDVFGSALGAANDPNEPGILFALEK